MSIYLTILMLFAIIKVFLEASNQEIENIEKNPNSTNEEDLKVLQFINKDSLQFFYFNSVLGPDKKIEMEFNNVSAVSNYWLKDLPLKCITHGWHTSEKKVEGIFEINTAYINLGGFNIITMDWSGIASNLNYAVPAVLTKTIGSGMATFLEHVVNLTGILPSDIHLIGHSLGAHVVGSCGSHFRLGKIGRITGLDPARPGFEKAKIDVPHLNIDNAQFVDIIHTTAGTIGFSSSIGHVDFFPNSGKAFQPGCHSILDFLDLMRCSHIRAYHLYADSVVHRNSLIGVSCSSWNDYKDGKCDNELHTPMGHDVSLSAKGNFYLKTESTSPFGTT